ncbi:MAG: hypothetical protein ACK4TD_11750 [Ectopseudomonas guguanensis]|uniref:hypothetical protein n=1 Tax=Ectopseudomonas guguanensis TaxID=1198456 RepID=UPI00391BDD87
MKYSNPARRLHTILSAGRERVHTGACKLVWADLLGVDANSPELLRKLARVMMLPDEILKCVEQEFPSRLAIQKHWVSPVKNAFESQNLSGQWQTFNAHIKESVVDFLAMTSDLIEERLAPDDISDEDLERIRAAFNKVLNEVPDSNLPDDVKVALSRAVSRIIIAIDDYRISGSAEMLAAIDMAFGKAVYDEVYREALSMSSVGKSFIEAVNVVAGIVTVATAVPLILDMTKKLLGND